MLLSICIPTYNRSEKVCELLKYLEYEIKKNDDLKLQFEIIVGDNSSDKLTQDICINTKLYKQNRLKYIKNENNIGLIGNVLNLASISNGEYVWIMGDDDIYHENILFLIKQAILEDDYSYIYLNHRAYQEGKIGLAGFNSAVDLSKKFIYEDGRGMALDIWNCSQTSLMFISASVFKSEILQNCIKSQKNKNLAFPLYMSFYSAAQGKTKIIDKICIDNLWGDTSWSKSSHTVFNKFVPLILYLLPNIGYSYTESRKIFFRFISTKIKGILIFKIKGLLTIRKQ
jgi:glycosyltransferase involved in cell wall biosynthesis